jgi:hypothetical protein
MPFLCHPGCHLNAQMQTVEKRPREMMLRREFTNAVVYLNTIFPEEKQLQFIHWDYHKFAKRYICISFHLNSNL